MRAAFKSLSVAQWLENLLNALHREGLSSLDR